MLQIYDEGKNCSFRFVTRKHRISAFEMRERRIFQQKALCHAKQPRRCDALHPERPPRQPAGIYFVSVTDAEGRKCVKKVVKE